MSVEIDRQRKLFRGILLRALDDLNSLLNGYRLYDENDTPLTDVQRADLLSDTREWFETADPSVCSLEVVCEALGINPDVQREKARALIRGTVHARTRRYRLSPAQLQDIRRSLSAGQSTRQICERLKIDQSTVRKARIRFRRARVRNATA